MANRNHLTASPLGALGGLFFALGVYPALQAPGYSWVVLAGTGVVLLVTLFYLLASVFQRRTWGEAMRGALVGLNAGLNGLLLGWLTSSLWVAAMIALLGLLPSWLYLSRRPWLHSLLGWANWLLPMSWLVNLPGLIMFGMNLLAAPLGWLHPLLRPLRIRIYLDLPSCTFTVFGGLIRPLMHFSGLNMGNFIFINPGWEHLLKHEIGHLFSLAAMGAVFHYVGGIDEGYVQEKGPDALAEHFAESYSRPAMSVLSMWR
jgi:hypothetical protein